MHKKQQTIDTYEATAQEMADKFDAFPARTSFSQERFLRKKNGSCEKVLLFYL